MRAFKRYSRSGFTLVELMIVVAIIGILAALAIYGVRRYLASAKTSEAKNTIGAIARGGQQAYEREAVAQELLPEGTESTLITHNICGGLADSATTVVSDAVPTSAGPPPRAKKYQPNSTEGQDYATGDNLNGWKCLKFQMTSPHYYQYGYRADPVDPTGGAAIAAGGPIPPAAASIADIANDGEFLAWAVGDIDDDGFLSGFGQRAQVNTVTRSIRLATQVELVEEFE